jgi:hypothetical protein
MTAWVPIIFVSAFGEYAIPGIESQAECRALAQRILKRDAHKGDCYEYKIAHTAAAID